MKRTLIILLILAATAARAEEPIVVDISAVYTNPITLYDATGQVMLSTNKYIAATNYIFDTIEYMLENKFLTNVVKQLAKGGYICNVYGHSWRDGRPGEGEGSSYGGWFLDYHPGVWYRTCRICGVCQSQKMGEWK